MKHILLFLLIDLLATTGNAQYTSRDTAIQRQSYVFDDFVTGTVLLKSKEVSYAPLNYCSYDQTILFKQGAQVMTLTGLETIDTVYIADKKFIPVANVVYEVVDGKGKIELCASYVGKLVPWTATTDHNGTERKQSNEVSNTVSSVYVTRPYKGDFSMQVTKKYWLKSFNEIHKANNLKDFLRVFKESTNPSISEYVSQSHIDFNNEADLVKLVDFCNGK